MGEVSKNEKASKKRTMGIEKVMNYHIFYEEKMEGNCDLMKNIAPNSTTPNC